MLRRMFALLNRLGAQKLENQRQSEEAENVQSSLANRSRIML